MTTATTNPTTVINEGFPAPLIAPQRTPTGDGVFFVVRDGYRVHALPGARRHQRRHLFDDLGSFARWRVRHATDRQRTEILVEDLSIHAGLSPGDLHGDQVVCALVHDPRFIAWSAAFKAPIPQRRFHSLIRAQRDTLQPEVLAMLLAALRDFTITRGAKRQIKLDERNLIRYAAESNEQDVAGAIPADFTVLLPVFEGVGHVAPAIVSSGGDPLPALKPGSMQLLEPGETLPTFTPPPLLYPIEVLLSLEEQQGGDIAFMLEAPALEVTLRRARRDAAAYLSSLLGEGFLVGLGKFVVESVPAFDTPPTVEREGDGRGQAL